MNQKIKSKNIGLENLQPVINDLIAAEDQYENAWDNFLETVPALENDRFWKMVDSLRDLIVKLSVGKYAINKHVIKQGVSEFFRLAQVKNTFYNFDEAIQFIKNWSKVKTELHEKLFGVITDKSDDGYNDFIDSLPLAGQGVYNNCVNKKYKNGNQIFEYLTLQVSESYAKIIMFGENYFEMSLRDEAKNRAKYI